MKLVKLKCPQCNANLEVNDYSVAAEPPVLLK